LIILINLITIMNYYKEYVTLDSSETGYLESKENKFYVNGKEVTNNRGCPGDEVILNNLEVVDIKNRNKRKIIGIIDCNAKYKISILDRRGKTKIFHVFSPLDHNYSKFYVSCNIKNKQGLLYALIEFQKWPVHTKYPFGSLIEFIGQLGNIQDDLVAYMYYCDIFKPTYRIQKERMKEHQKIIESIQKEDYEIFTIDPEGSKDLDDGFHFKQEDNLIEIGIHIACPSFFLNQEEDLSEIVSRCSTIYSFKNFHLIPNKYSTDLCSLLENTNRKTLCFILKFREDSLIEKEIKICDVKVKKNYKYEEFQINNEKEFQFFSAKYFREELDSHQLVEKWMIHANCLIVEHCQNLKLENIIVRVHKKNEHFLKNNSLLEKYLHQKNENKATYEILTKEQEQEHSKMGCLYTHFTSPIRRAIDFILQTMIINNLKINNMENIILQVNNHQKKIKKFYNIQKKIQFIHNHKEDKITSKAYIIKLKEEYTKLYCQEYDFEIKYYKMVDKYQELEEVNIEIYLFPFEIHLKKKIQVKII